jgi:dihydroneopterin aldolase
MTDSVKIFVRDCKTQLRVGIYASEMDEPQPVTISVEAEAAMPHRFQNVQDSSLKNVIDYEPIYNFVVTELPKLGHIPLLETVAEQIIDFCFRDPRIESVRVHAEKTAILHGTVAGISLNRTRAPIK